MIGLDTSAIIDLYKKEPSIINLLKKVKEDMASTIITYQEIMFGIDLNDSMCIQEEKYYEDFFNRIFILDMNTKSAKKSSEILWGLKKKGINPEKFDCMIAGILFVNGVDKIITKNKKHFKNIKNLEVISY